MSKEIFIPKGRLYENNDNDVVRRLLPLSMKLYNKLSKLTEEYHELNDCIQQLNEKEAELKIKHNNFRNKQLELDKIEKKLKEKNSIKVELSNLIECYSMIIRNSQDLLKNKVDEIIKRKVYLMKKEMLLNKIIEVKQGTSKSHSELSEEMDLILAKRKNQSKLINPSNQPSAGDKKPLSNNTIHSLSVSYLKQDKNELLSISNNIIHNIENRKEKPLEKSSSSFEYNAQRRTYSAPHLIQDNVAIVTLKENRNKSYTDLSNREEMVEDKRNIKGVENNEINKDSNEKDEIMNEQLSERIGKPERKQKIETKSRNIDDNKSNEAINDILRRICETDNKSEFESINHRENDNVFNEKLFLSNSMIKKDTYLRKRSNNNIKVQEIFMSNKEINDISKMYNLNTVNDDYYNSFNPLTKTPHFLKEIHYVSNTNINPFSSIKNKILEMECPNDISKNQEETSVQMNINREVKEELSGFLTHNISKIKEDPLLTQTDYLTKNLKNVEDMNFTFKKPTDMNNNNNLNVSNVNLNVINEIHGSYEWDFNSCEKINPNVNINVEEINYTSKKTIDKSIEKTIRNGENVGTNNCDNNSNLLERYEIRRSNEENYENSNNIKGSVNLSLRIDSSLLEEKSFKDQKLMMLDNNQSNKYDNSSNLIHKRIDSNSIFQENKEMNSNNLSELNQQHVNEEGVWEEKSAFEKIFEFNSIKGVNIYDNNSNNRVSKGNSRKDDHILVNSNNLRQELHVSLNRSSPYISNVESIQKTQIQDQNSLNIVRDNNSNLKLTDNERERLNFGENVSSNNQIKENVELFIGHSVFSQLSIEGNSNHIHTKENERSVNVPDCKSNDNKYISKKEISSNNSDFESNNIEAGKKSIILILNEKEENDLINNMNIKKPLEVINKTNLSNNNLSHMKIEVYSNNNISNDLILKEASEIRDKSINSYSKILTKLPDTRMSVYDKKIENLSNNKVDNMSEAEIRNNVSNNKNMLIQENVMSVDNHIDLSQMLNNLNISAIMTNNNNIKDGQLIDENKSNIFNSKRENELSFIENNSNNNQDIEQKLISENDFFSKNILEQLKKNSDEVIKNLSVDNHSNIDLAKSHVHQNMRSIISSQAGDISKKDRISDATNQYVSNSDLHANNIKKIEPQSEFIGYDHISNNNVDEKVLNRRSRLTTDENGNNLNDENIPIESNNLLKSNVKEDVTQNNVEKITVRGSSGFINRKSVKTNFQTDNVSQTIKTESLVDNEETLIKTDKINKKDDPLNNEVDNKRYFKNSSNIFRKEKKMNSAKNLINTEYLIYQEKLKNFIETNRKGRKNILISTDNSSVNDIESVLKKSIPLSSIKEPDNQSSRFIIETLTISQLNQNTLANKLILFPDTYNINYCVCINKSFNAVINPPENTMRDISNYSLNIESSVQIQCNPKPSQNIINNKSQNNSNLRNIYNEDSNKNKENLVTAARTNGSRVVSYEEIKSNYNVSSIIHQDGFNSFNREISIQVGKKVDEKLLLFEKTIEKPRRYSLYNLKLKEFTEIIEKELNIFRRSKSVKQFTRKRLDLKLNEPFAPLKSEESIKKRDSNANLSEKSVLDTSADFQVVILEKDDEEEEDEDEILSDEMILQFKQQELKMKQMADDSLKKEVHLKQVINNLQNILNKPLDKA